MKDALPLRILFHIHALSRGGAERQLAALASGMAERGHEVTVATFHPGGPHWDFLAESHGVNLVSLNRAGRLDFAVIGRLAKLARTAGASLIQGWMPPNNTFAAIAGRLVGCPVVMGVRASDFVVSPPRRRLAAGSYVYSDGWSGRLWSTAIVCNSDRGRSHHLSLGYPRSKTIVIPNGLEVPVARFPEPFASGPPWNVGMLARFDPFKDHATALRSLRFLLDAGESVRLHLFGDGPETYKKEIQALAFGLDLGNAISWHGDVQDPMAALASVDILISSSATSEGMSNAVMEGMAAGRVVVSTDVGDARALLAGQYGAGGYLVPPRDPCALAEAIRKALAEPSVALERAKRAREVIRAHYSTATMLNRYEALYRRVVSGAPLEVSLASDEATLGLVTPRV